MIMANASRTLEITVISSEGLKINHKRAVKKNAYAIIRTDSCNYRVTKVDKEGGSSPWWNEKFVVDMPAYAKFITVEVQCKGGSTSGDRLIGVARIPVSDFVGGFTPESYTHFLSYRLREADGERNGIVNLSVKVKVPEYVGGDVSRTTWQGTPVGEKGCGEVVTGVPVWYRYPVQIENRASSSSSSFFVEK